MPRFRIIVDDLAGLEFSDLYARELAPAVLMMLILHRLAFRNEHLDRDLQPHIEVLRAVEDSPNATNDLFSLFTDISKVSETNARDLGRLVDQLGPLAKEVAMTTAEQLRAEGEAKSLLRQLAVKFGPLQDEVVDRIQAGDSAELERWTERVLTATALDEFFA